MESRSKSSEFAFSDLVHSGKVYFDQTLLVAQLTADTSPCAIVLTSPSGFGKSVILSMCHAFTDKYAEPSLFDKRLLKTTQSTFFANHHHRYFDLYFDFASLAAENLLQFKSQLWLLMRDMILTAKDKLQHWVNHAVMINHPGLEKILVSDYQPDLENELLHAIFNLCQWLSAQGVESQSINIYLDNYDAASRAAFIDGNLSLCKKISDFISRLLFFISEPTKPYHKMILAGQESVGDSHKLASSYQHKLEYINVYSGHIQLGITAQEIRDNCPALSNTDIETQCGWYRTSKQTVTNFSWLQTWLGYPQPAHPQQSSYPLLRAAIALFGYNELTNAYHTLGLLGEPEIYKRDFALSAIGQYDSWFPQLLLATGAITFVDKETALTAITTRMFVDIVFMNDSVLEEIEKLLNTRRKQLQPQYTQQGDTLFHRRPSLSDAFKQSTPYPCVIL